MRCRRLAELNELVESAEDPIDRADHARMMQVEVEGAWWSPLDDFEDGEQWRRMFTAYVQPLADAAD